MNKTKAALVMKLSLLILVVLTICTVAPSNAFAQADQSVSTFTNFQTAISSAPTDGTEYTIEITADITFPSALSIPSDKKIKVISDGNGPWELTVSATHRHFIVNGTASLSGILTLENIILDGGDTAGGVAVYAGTLVLNTGATIRNCYSNTNGGGIFASDERYNSVVTLKLGSVVSGNEANANVSNTSGNVGRGGGVYANPATFTMEKGAVVSDNIATYGGGISIGGTASINGIVSSNISYRNGGGIYYQQLGTQVLSMDGAEITRNIAYGYAGTSVSGSNTKSGGGGLLIATSTATSDDFLIKDSDFSQNQAPSARNTSINNGQDYFTGMQKGGAIYVMNGKAIDTRLVLDGCTFTENEAQLGGALYLNCETDITASVFSNNKAYDDRDNADSSGGAILFNAARYTAGDTYLLRISGGAVKDNSAYRAAGISYVNANVTKIYVDGTEFENNQIIADGYVWDVNNPTGYERRLYVYGLTPVEIYAQNITNVTTATSPYTNIYNNADIAFMLYRVVTYDGNGGAFLYSDINSEFGSSFTADLPGIALAYIQGSPLEHIESIPSKTDDTFLGWYLEDLETPAPEADTPVYENYIFYALWQSMLHTVTYDPGTTESVSNMPQPGTVSVVEGMSFTVSSSVPSRSGYTFGGWNMEADGSGTSYISEGTFTVATDVTLYAQWTEDATKPPVEPAPPKKPVPPEKVVTRTSILPETGDVNSLIWVSPLIITMTLLGILLLVKRRSFKA